MKKALLVALREYVENLRTKTFWIGIAFLPIILILSVVVPKLLSDVKDVRTYAVLDRSGWLLDEVDRRSAMPDLAAVYREVIELGPDSERAVELFPTEIRENVRVFLENTREFDEGKRDEMLDQAMGLLTSEKVAGIDPSALPEPQRKIFAAIAEYRERVNAWYRSLAPEEAARFGASLDRGRFTRASFPDATEEDLAKKLAAGEIFAYFVVGEDVVSNNEGSHYVSNNRTDEELRQWFTRYATQAIRERRFEERQIARADVEYIQAPVVFSREEISKTGERQSVGDQDVARAWAPVFFVYFLWISIFSIAQMLLTNTIEEKSNRIIEVLLSSISPVQLMSGKIAGIAFTGLTIVSSWILVMFLGIKFVLPDEHRCSFDLGHQGGTRSS
ncbi:MAG: ABC transporter permease [Planctomycetota bacterium]